MNAKNTLEESLSYGNISSFNFSFWCGRQVCSSDNHLPKRWKNFFQVKRGDDCVVNICFDARMHLLYTCCCVCVMVNVFIILYLFIRRIKQQCRLNFPAAAVDYACHTLSHALNNSHIVHLAKNKMKHRDMRCHTEVFHTRTFILFFTLLASSPPQFSLSSTADYCGDTSCFLKLI